MVWDMTKVKEWNPSLLHLAGLAFNTSKEKTSGRHGDARKQKTAPQLLVGEKPSGGPEIFQYADLLGQKTYLELC